jgi:hypothetical protein
MGLKYAYTNGNECVDWTVNSMVIKQKKIRLEVSCLLMSDTFRIVSVIATAVQVGHTARATIFEAATSGDAQRATITPATVRIWP